MYICTTVLTVVNPSGPISYRAVRHGEQCFGSPNLQDSQLPGSWRTRVTFCSWPYCFGQIQVLGGNWYVILVSWTSICSRTRTEYVAFALTRWFVLECPEQVFFCYLGNLPSFFAWAGLHHFTEYDHISRHSLQKSLKDCWNVPNSVDIVTSTTEMSEMCCNSALERHKLDHIKLQPALWISDQVNQASAKHFSEVSWIFRLSARMHQLPTLGMSRMSFASASGNLLGYRDIGIWMWLGELVQPPTLDFKQRCLWKFACKSEQKLPFKIHMPRKLRNRAMWSWCASSLEFQK